MDETLEGAGVALLAPAADEVQTRVGVVEAAVRGERLHDVVLRLVRGEPADEQPGDRGGAGGCGRRLDVESREVEEDRDDGRARESGLDEVVLVVAESAMPSSRTCRELAQLSATPCHAVCGDGLPPGDVAHRCEVVMVDDDRLVAGEHRVGDDRPDRHLVHDDVGVGAACIAQEVRAPASSTRLWISAAKISEVWPAARNASRTASVCAPTAPGSRVGAN